MTFFNEKRKEKRIEKKIVHEVSYITVIFLKCLLNRVPCDRDPSATQFCMQFENKIRIQNYSVRGSHAMVLVC